MGSGWLQQALLGVPHNPLKPILGKQLSLLYIFLICWLALSTYSDRTTWWHMDHLFIWILQDFKWPKQCVQLLWAGPAGPGEKGEAGAGAGCLEQEGTRNEGWGMDTTGGRMLLTWSPMTYRCWAGGDSNSSFQLSVLTHPSWKVTRCCGEQLIKHPNGFCYQQIHAGGRDCKSRKLHTSCVWSNLCLSPWQNSHWLQMGLDWVYEPHHLQDVGAAWTNARLFRCHLWLLINWLSPRARQSPADKPHGVHWSHHSLTPCSQQQPALHIRLLSWEVRLLPKHYRVLQGEQNGSRPTRVSIQVVCMR